MLCKGRSVQLRLPLAPRVSKIESTSQSDAFSPVAPF
jgi:hypothetical protein